MASRGPDGAGLWSSPDGRVVLGHRRLSIIDVSERAAQPMLSADGTLAITFNGEIYNYRELRQELEARGRSFRTSSDTEVLLQLYAERGQAMLESLRGMFAFAIWDGARDGLLLARDPYGIKPLYVSGSDRGVFRFASQVKALIQGGGISLAKDPAASVGFCLFGSVPEPFTTYREIRSLPAGTSMWVAPSATPEPRAYFDLAGEFARAAAAGDASADVEQRVGAAVRSSVRAHLVADVPVGVFLSAGIDSGAIAALAAESSAETTRGLTITFDEFAGGADDESPLAAEVARTYGVEHTRRVVTRAEFERDVPKIWDAMDQPTIDGINTWFVSKGARELGLKVALSGLGGDELWGGYPSFRDVPRWTRWTWLPSRMPGLGRALRSLAAPILRRSRWSPKIAGVVELGGDVSGAYLLRRGLFMPWELPALLDRDALEEGLARLRPLEYIGEHLDPDPGTDFGRVATLESALYMRNQLLRDTDWASMAHSLEVRTPLVDSVLLHEVARFTVRRGEPNSKALLARAPRTPLPRAISERRKTGFTTPIAAWLLDNRELDAWRSVPSLARPGCHWSRRLGYATLRHFLGA